MDTDLTSREYLSLYRQHLNTMQSFFDLNNNIIVGINNTLSLRRPPPLRRQTNERNFIPFSNLSLPQNMFHQYLPARNSSPLQRPLQRPIQRPIQRPEQRIPPPPPPGWTGAWTHTMPAVRPTRQAPQARQSQTRPPQTRQSHARPPQARPPQTRPPGNFDFSNRASQTPFFFNTTFNRGNLENTLNNSLYDTYPQVPLPEENFNTQTTSNSWINIRNIYDLSNNQICPISRENFTDDVNVVRINHCGHIFTRTQLLNWFQFDTRCPICRHDLSTRPATTGAGETTGATTGAGETTGETRGPGGTGPGGTGPGGTGPGGTGPPTTGTGTSPVDQTLNDISENIYNLSNEIATNVMNVFSDLSNTLNNPDNSNNIFASDFLLNIPNLFNTPRNSTFFQGTNYHNSYNNQANPFNMEQSILNPDFIPENIASTTFDTSIGNEESDEENDPEDDYVD